MNLPWPFVANVMPLLIGTDEAGYGPNLGPLTICATSWEVPDAEIDLYEHLAEIVSPKSIVADKITICDSKSIYSPSSPRSLANLEMFVLAILYSLHDTLPQDAGQLWSLISGDRKNCPLETPPWSNTFLKLPIAAEKEHVLNLGRNFSSVCKEFHIGLKQICCRAVFPADFNRLIDKFGNKAELLSVETLMCLKEVSEHSAGVAETQIVCDKHGGRSKYASLLNQCLTEQFVHVVNESRELSEYRWSEENQKYRICFQSKGESFLPTALASMVAKYFREVSMEIWNGFWIEKIPGLKPTKGYPLDAKRFKKEIANTQLELGISDSLIWRSR